MKVRTDFHTVNLATGERTRSVVGGGERKDETVGVMPNKKNMFGDQVPATTKIAKVLPMVQATYTASCRMMVTGIEMACPLCGTLVQSGDRHSCKVTRRAK